MSTISEHSTFETPRNLRRGERFLVAPPLVGFFGTERVAVCDVSARGARLRHPVPFESGAKAEMKLLVDKRPPLVLDATVIWTQQEASGTTGYISGLRLHGDAATIDAFLAELHATGRSTRIEELRAIDRFLVMPALKATFAGRPVYMEDLSSHGARIETLKELPVNTPGELRFQLGEEDFRASGKVVWSALKSMTGQFTTYRSGLSIPGDSGTLRMAIGHLEIAGNAVLDTQSLRLKLKVMRARARSMARTHPGSELVGMAPEQYLLIEGVRQELRLNPEEAFYWYKRARLSIADPDTRAITPPISDHPDALAVWEYLDRSIDPTIIGRAFELHVK